MADLPFISVIIPVRNGEGKLEHCLESLKAQDYPEDKREIIVADGRSSDRTVEIAERFGATVVDNPRVIQGAGRNEGIKTARGDLIAIVDDDCLLPPQWLRAGREHLRDSEAAGVGGPTPLPDSEGGFPQAVNLIFQWASMAGYSVQSDRERSRKVDDLPGCNSMYKKEALLSMGPFREDLLTGEEVDMHMRMRKRGLKLLFAPDFFAWHLRKDSPRRFFRQMRGFAIGRIQVGRAHRGAVRPLHWITAMVAPVALLVAAAGVIAGWYAPISAAAVVCAAGLFTAGLISSGSLKVGLWVVPAAVIFFVSWSHGFFTEILFPIKRKG